MPPAVGRMHPSHMSNPFQHLNPQHSIPHQPQQQQQSASHYATQSQSQHLPNNFTPHPAFAASSGLNGGITPFNPSSAYGSTAFSNIPGAGATTFNGGSGVGAGGLLNSGGGGQGLASVAAQQGFARGAAMQEHSHLLASAPDIPSKQLGGAMGRIREVWRHNLESEFAVLRQLVRTYPYVSMDAEFPGIVARPIGNFLHSKAEYHYQTLRCNVDILKPIQVGITLWTSEGELPPSHPTPELLAHLSKNEKFLPPASAAAAARFITIPCTWVFNFQFNLDVDMYAETSIELLKTSGVDFHRHLEMGISPGDFGSLLTTSGLVFTPDVHWLSFHSGYDFGYLIKLLTDNCLPEDQNQFFEQVETFFPKLWDIKFLLRHAQRQRAAGRLTSADGVRIIDALGQKSGLQDLADELGCARVGPSHTGGSDAWLTGSVFWAMRSKIFGGNLDDDLADQIYGLHGVPAPASQQYRDEFLAAQGTPAAAGAQAANGVSALGQTFTPGATVSAGGGPSTPTSSHVALHGQASHTPGPGGHFGAQASQGGGFGAASFAGYGK